MYTYIYMCIYKDTCMHTQAPHAHTLFHSYTHTQHAFMHTRTHADKTAMNPMVMMQILIRFLELCLNL